MTNNINDSIRSQVGTMNMPSSQQTYSQVLNLTLGAPVSLDFKTLANLHQIENIQGIWIDNSQGTGTVTATVVATLQNFTVPTGYQGVAPLYVSPDNVISFTGAGTVTIVFLNFPTPVGVWPAASNSGQQTFSGMYLNTQDKNIALAMDQNSVDVVPKYYTGGDGLVHKRSGNVISGRLTASGSTVLLAGAPSVFLSSIDVAVDGYAELAAQGYFYVTLLFGTSAKQIFQRGIYLNNTLPSQNNLYQLISLSDVDYIGALTGDNLTIQLSATLTVGAVNYTIGCGTTAVQ